MVPLRLLGKWRGECESGLFLGRAPPWEPILPQRLLGGVVWEEGTGTGFSKHVTQVDLSGGLLLCANPAHRLHIKQAFT